MTARKPNPKPRKASGPTLEQRVANLERFSHPPVYNHVPEILARLDAIESRDRLRDKSHDEPVSNANEVIGLYPPTTPVRHEWRRCSQDEFFAILSPRREHWWQFWRRG